MNFWESFRNTFLTDEAYENFSSDGTAISLPVIVIGLFCGIAIALIATVFTKRVWGGMVRKLLEAEACSAESAKTLAELSLDKNLFLRRAVKGNVTLRRVVRCREEEEYLAAQAALAEAEAGLGEDKRAKKKAKKLREKPFRIDPDVHHFYVPEECRSMAGTKFGKSDTSIAKLLILLAFLAICLVVILLLLPRVMGLVDDLVGTMKSAASSGSDQIVS